MKTKEEANYRDAASEAKCCGTCSMYRPQTETCTLVRGIIREDDVCDYWEKQKK